MATLLTGNPIIEQVKNKVYRVLTNSVCILDDGTVAYVPRKFLTDNFTWINPNASNIVASHFHDVPCQYRKIIYIDLPVEEINKKYIYFKCGRMDCKDIPIEHLKLKDMNFRQTNDLFNQVLKASGASKWATCYLSAGVYLNAGWAKDNFLWRNGGQPKINLEKLYIEDWGRTL